MSPVNYQLELPGQRRHPTFHVSLLKKADRTTPLATTTTVKEEYEVEKILDQRRKKGALQYLVK